MASPEVLEPEQRYVLEQWEQISSVATAPCVLLGLLVLLGLRQSGAAFDVAVERGVLPAVAITLGPVALLYLLGIAMDLRLRHRYGPRVEALRGSLPLSEEDAIEHAVSRGSSFTWLILVLLPLYLVFWLDEMWLASVAVAVGLATLSVGVVMRRAPLGRHWRGFAMAFLVVAALAAFAREAFPVSLAVMVSIALLAAAFAWSGVEQRALLRRALPDREPTLPS